MEVSAGEGDENGTMKDSQVKADDSSVEVDDSESDNDGLESADEIVNLAKCNTVTFEKREGTPGVKFTSGDGEGWTPVRRRRYKKNLKAKNSDEEDDLFVPEPADVKYFKVNNIPGLSVHTRKVRYWTPVAARTRKKCSKVT